MAAKTRYSLIQRLLHWAVALIAPCVLAVGLTLGLMGFDSVMAHFGQDVTNLLYKYHKSFGVVVLGLMTLRLIFRLILGKPDHAPPLPAWQRVASSSVHGLLYLALLVQPVLGWAATAAGGYPIEFFSWVLPGFLSKDPALSHELYRVHFALGWLILGLMAVHVAAALLHWLVLRDGVIRRISLS